MVSLRLSITVLIWDRWQQCGLGGAFASGTGRKLQDQPKLR